MIVVCDFCGKEQTPPVAPIADEVRIALAAMFEDYAAQALEQGGDRWAADIWHKAAAMARDFVYRPGLQIRDGIVSDSG